MINAELLPKLLLRNNLILSQAFWQLKEFTKLLTQNEFRHIIASNEGSALLGIGNIYQQKPRIYFQNSGLPNALNPLFSIAHKKVYSIPLILLIDGEVLCNKRWTPYKIKGEVTEKMSNYSI